MKLPELPAYNQNMNPDGTLRTSSFSHFGPLYDIFADDEARAMATASEDEGALARAAAWDQRLSAPDGLELFHSVQTYEQLADLICRGAGLEPQYRMIFPKQ